VKTGRAASKLPMAVDVTPLVSFSLVLAVRQVLFKKASLAIAGLTPAGALPVMLPFNLAAEVSD
jgi:hypothetical protein